MQNRKFYTCCFTGHRPSKLPWGYDENCKLFLNFKKFMKKLLKKTIKLGFVNFISGMALGTDLLCAELILELKKKYPNIKLECAIPCKNQTLKWSLDDIERYNRVIANADLVTYVSNYNYFNGCMQKRNRYMVDKSNLVLAIFNGSPGGTAQTIKYSNLKKIPTFIIKP